MSLVARDEKTTGRLRGSRGDNELVSKARMITRVGRMKNVGRRRTQVSNIAGSIYSRCDIGSSNQLLNYLGNYNHHVFERGNPVFIDLHY